MASLFQRALQPAPLSLDGTSHGLFLGRPSVCLATKEWKWSDILEGQELAKLDL